MKILLAAVNAKYIHSNPAVYSLRACVEEALMPYVEIAEYTINNKKEEILASLYREKPTMIAFLLYLELGYDKKSFGGAAQNLTGNGSLARGAGSFL